MLKKIHAKQVRLGMHIHELCGPRINHPFWRSKFILTDPADLRRLMESGITELWIDSSKEIPLDVCLHHHEKVDGSGYPHHLKDAEISLFAKMVAVCDVYDAITSNRPYKQGWDPAESIKKMTEWSSEHFDQKIFQTFVKCIGIYPTGALVRLSSVRLGVVLDQSAKSLLTHQVKVFFSTESQAYIQPEVVDLSRPNCPERIMGREDAVKWGIKNLHELWAVAT